MTQNLERIKAYFVLTYTVTLEIFCFGIFYNISQTAKPIVLLRACHFAKELRINIYTVYK